MEYQGPPGTIVGWSYFTKNPTHSPVILSTWRLVKQMHYKVVGVHYVQQSAQGKMVVRLKNQDR